MSMLLKFKTLVGFLTKSEDKNTTVKKKDSVHIVNFTCLHLEALQVFRGQ